MKTQALKMWPRTWTTLFEIMGMDGTELDQMCALVGSDVDQLRTRLATARTPHGRCRVIVTYPDCLVLTELLRGYRDNLVALPPGRRPPGHLHQELLRESEDDLHRAEALAAQLGYQPYQEQERHSFTFRSARSGVLLLATGVVVSLVSLYLVSRPARLIPLLIGGLSVMAGIGVIGIAVCAFWFGLAGRLFGKWTNGRQTRVGGDTHPFGRGGLAVLLLAAVILCLGWYAWGNNSANAPESAPGGPIANADMVFLTRLHEDVPGFGTSDEADDKAITVAHEICLALDGTSSMQDLYDRMVRVDSVSAGSFLRAAVTIYCPQHASGLGDMKW
jgi:hypothetical protein